MATTDARRRRLELRITPDERELIDRAVLETDTDLTEFVVANAVEAARRVLADRDRFELDVDALAEWEAVSARGRVTCPGCAGSCSAPHRSPSDQRLSATRAARRSS